MPDIGAVDVVLWAVAVAGLVWAFTPPLAHGWGLFLFRFTAKDDPRAVEPDGRDADYEQKYRELIDLGFRPVGVLTEHYWLFTLHWYKAFSFRCLSTADGTCLVGLYRLGNEPVRVKFDTYLGDGFLVRTVMPGAGVEDQGELWARFEEPAVGVPELYARHQQHVNLVRLKAGEPRAVTLAEAVRLDEAQERTRPRPAGGEHFVFPTMFVLGAVVLSILFSHRVWGTPPSAGVVAGAVILGSLLYLGFLQFVLPFFFNSTCGKEGEERARRANHRATTDEGPLPGAGDAVSREGIRRSR
jgi:hypothetical protein